MIRNTVLKCMSNDYSCKKTHMENILKNPTIAGSFSLFKLKTPHCNNETAPKQLNTKVSITAKSPSPSLAGQTAIVNQAILLAPGHSYLRLLRFFKSNDIPAESLADTVAGPRWHLTNFLIKSVDT